MVAPLKLIPLLPEVTLPLTYLWRTLAIRL